MGVWVCVGSMCVCDSEWVWVCDSVCGSVGVCESGCGGVWECGSVCDSECVGVWGWGSVSVCVTVSGCVGSM